MKKNKAMVVKRREEVRLIWTFLRWLNELIIGSSWSNGFRTFPPFPYFFFGVGYSEDSYFKKKAD